MLDLLGGLFIGGVLWKLIQKERQRERSDRTRRESTQDGQPSGLPRRSRESRSYESRHTVQKQNSSPTNGHRHYGSFRRNSEESRGSRYTPNGSAYSKDGISPLSSRYDAKHHRVDRTQYDRYDPGNGCDPSASSSAPVPLVPPIPYAPGYLHPRQDDETVPLENEAAFESYRSVRNSGSGASIQKIQNVVVTPTATIPMKPLDLKSVQRYDESVGQCEAMSSIQTNDYVGVSTKRSLVERLSNSNGSIPPVRHGSNITPLSTSDYREYHSTLSKDDFPPTRLPSQDGEYILQSTSPTHKQRSIEYHNQGKLQQRLSEYHTLNDHSQSFLLHQGKNILHHENNDNQLKDTSNGHSQSSCEDNNKEMRSYRGGSNYSYPSHSHVSSRNDTSPPISHYRELNRNTRALYGSSEDLKRMGTDPNIPKMPRRNLSQAMHSNKKRNSRQLPLSIHAQANPREPVYADQAQESVIAALIRLIPTQADLFGQPENVSRSEHR